MVRSGAGDHEANNVIRRVALTDRDVRDAARLLRLLADSALVANIHPDELSSEPRLAQQGSLVAMARAMLTARKLRARHLPPVMLGEPAWDILLMLYVSDRLALSRLAEWTEIPLATITRWVNCLEEWGFVERLAHPADKRTTLVKMREKGRSALNSYLGSMPG